MRPILERLDYATRDYEGFRTLMIKKLQEIMPEYTDTRQSDAGIVLIELNAMCLDILSYYLDSIANECFLVTATQRSNIMKFCKMLGYTPRFATSAVYLQRFYRSDITRALTIKAGTRVKTYSTTQNGSMYFTTLNDLVIDGDEEYGETRVIHGVRVTSEKHHMGTTKNQRISLNYSPALIDNTFIVRVQRPNEQVNETWSRVNSFAGAKSTSKVYMVEVNDKNETEIVFGDNVFGAIPENCNVLVSYFVGGGSAGNVGNKTIKVMVDNIAGVKETYNVEQLIEGHDRETLDEIKVNAPVAYRNIWGALTCKDYAGVIKTYFPDVNDAQAIRASEDWTRLEVDDIMIYTLTGQEIKYQSENSESGYFVEIPSSFYDGGSYSELMNNIQDFFNSDTDYVDIGTNTVLDSARKLVGTRNIFVVPPLYEPITIKATLKVRDNYSFETISQQIKDYLINYFRLGNLEFGEDISLQEIMYQILDSSGIDGIRYLNFTLVDDTTTSVRKYNFENNDLIMPLTGTMIVLGEVIVQELHGN